MSLPEPARAGLVLLGRDGCGLCDEMQEALEEFARELPLPPLQHLDVDADPLLARRYGLDVPVLLLDGVKVCEHRLDAAELRRLLRGGRGPHRL
jgi:thiol-disulfide isomerase/thioredoxin